MPIRIKQSIAATSSSGPDGSAGVALPEGACYLPDVINLAQEEALLRQFDQGIWSTNLRRRVQHFGWRYDYKARSVTADMDLGPLPGWLDSLAVQLHHDGHFDAVPDQVIANEYLPGQGISAHVDCVPCFGDVISSLSLGSACVMRLAHLATGSAIDLPLWPRSLLILQGPARYDWTHAIPARGSDPGPKGRVHRMRRVSLTFRTVRLRP